MRSDVSSVQRDGELIGSDRVGGGGYRRDDQRDMTDVAAEVEEGRRRLPRQGIYGHRLDGRRFNH